MDEHKLAELFRDAVRDMPPASFDEGDVRSASKRVTARRRTQLALGSTMAAVLLVGGTVVATGLLARPDGGSTSASSGENSVMHAPAQGRGDSSNQEKSSPGDVLTQGSAPSWSVGGQSADNSTPQGCGTVDRKLADALAAELSVPADQAIPVSIGCPNDSRAAAFVVDGERISVIVTEPGAVIQYQANTSFTQLPTAAGRSVHVFAEPANGPAADRVQAIAGALLGQF